MIVFFELNGKIYMGILSSATDKEFRFSHLLELKMMPILPQATKEVFPRIGNLNIATNQPLFAIQIGPAGFGFLATDVSVIKERMGMYTIVSRDQLPDDIKKELEKILKEESSENEA